MARGPKPIKRVKSKGNFNASSSSSKASRPQKHSADTLAHWETPDDVEQDDEDRFHQQRDKILLDGSRGGDDGEDAFGNGTEVLGLEEDEDSEDYEGDESEGEGYYDEEDEGDDGEEEEEEEEEVAAPRKSKGKTAPTLHAKAAPEDDDEELSTDPEEEVGGWGPHKRAYYSTNNLEAMDSDSEMDVEERRQMEVREARKLQVKARQEMGDEDFGLGEALDTAQEGTLSGSGKAARERRRAELDGEADDSARLAVATPVATASVQHASAASVPAPALPVHPRQRAVLLAHVQKTTPETIALAGDYADVVDELGAVTVALKKATLDMPHHPSLGLMHVHHQVLLTYVTTLTFYFHLRSLPEYVAHPEKLAAHPIIARLIKLKTGVADMENYGFSAADVLAPRRAGEDSEDEMLSDEDGLEPGELRGIMGGSDGESESLGSLEQDELDALLADEKENHAVLSPRRRAAAAAAAAASASAAAKPKKVKKAKASAAAPAPLASLASFEMDDTLDDSFGEGSSSKTKKKAKLSSSAYDAEAAEGYGELTSLGASDTADKAARRKSLKFHTGQLQAKEARRGEAARQSLGGDADIPYRDRERSRTAVATAAANKAAKAAGLGGRDDMELDEEAFGEEDLRDWRDVMGAEAGLSGEIGEDAEKDEDEDYYDLVASRKRAAKKQKRDEYEAIANTERFLADPTLAEGEHRGINRQMEKNRGLTPHRPKSVRNPRVKKRIKFDKAQKKLSSTRAVYKGGAAALEGGYGGEKSGISNVIKSRTFN